MIDPQYPTDRIEACLKIAQPTAWLAIEDAGAPPDDLKTILDVPSIDFEMFRNLKKIFSRRISGL